MHDFTFSEDAADLAERVIARHFGISDEEFDYGPDLPDEDYYEDWDDVTEEFEPVVMYPVVAYHGSLRSEWGLYYISNSRDERLVLEPLHVGGERLRQVSRTSISGTGKFVNPDTGEIW